MTRTERVTDVQRGTDGLEEVLRAIWNSGHGTAVAMCRQLVSADDPGLDDALMRFQAAGYLRPRVRQLACRLLVQRDPHRDPAPLLHTPLRPSDEHGSLFRRTARPLVVEYAYGYSRLHALEPLRRYPEILAGGGLDARLNAAVGLGDTGDLAALDTLAGALADRHPAVRSAAADAVRRLRHAGRTAVRAHPVCDGLAGLLRDRKRGPRIAAARALGALGLTAPLRDLGLGDRVEPARVLAGNIPSLEPTWPGDDTI
ncbi:hypothetical protein CFN78_27790 [Amycolatopsis antarctica]|uniref:HEAT repeat domain-containing protein n=1 Tax=Amycolatopsis antarctica TaxID=1854586 RepID=A0A263CUZ8_9PSEU|nr:HEAT repeat domain-containing protein [Amycolatopsis antarctica]OZM69952.1 hypothetical protein CFN78_27790 [Amycolatopsis antarctica]